MLRRARGARVGPSDVVIGESPRGADLRRIVGSTMELTVRQVSQKWETCSQNCDASVNLGKALRVCDGTAQTRRTFTVVKVPRTDENGRQLKALLDYLLDGDIDAKDIYDALGTSSSTYYRRIKEADYPDAEELRRVADRFDLSYPDLQIRFGLMSQQEVLSYVESAPFGGGHRRDATSARPAPKLSELNPRRTLRRCRPYYFADPAAQRRLPWPWQHSSRSRSAVIAWSLWIRRVTWSCRWEVAATLNIALQGVAVLLMSPWASETLGPLAALADGQVEPRGLHRPRLLHRRRVGRSSTTRSVGSQDDHAMQQSFKQYVERPATLCIPLLLATFSLGNGARIYRPDFFEVPTDFWLNIYWLLLCGILIYLLGYGSRALLVLRRDPRSRRIANIYLLASASGHHGVHRPDRHRLRPRAAAPSTGGTLVWVFACMCGAGFALTSAHSWRMKTKWFSQYATR